MSATKSSKPTMSTRLMKALKDIEDVVIKTESPTMRHHIMDMVYSRLTDIENESTMICTSGR